MATVLTTQAIERSTYPVTVIFYDENGDVVSPNSGLTWTLTDGNGNVINNRSTVSITAAGTVTVVLSGADLDMDDGNERFLLLEGTYTGDLGADLPLKDQARFYITNLVGVS